MNLALMTALAFPLAAAMASEETPCPMSFDPVCGSDGETYSNTCVATSAGKSVRHRGECRNDNKRPDKRPGSSYCTWSRDNECYIEGWPQCCLDDGQECPPDRHPRCDNQSNQGWNYCTWAPDTTCYASGWPACCDRFGGTNCPTDHPNCDVNSEDTFKVKFLRNVH